MASEGQRSHCILEGHAALIKPSANSVRYTVNKEKHIHLLCLLQLNQPQVSFVGTSLRVMSQSTIRIDRYIDTYILQLHSALPSLGSSACKYSCSAICITEQCIKKKARCLFLVDFWNRLLLSEQYKISKLFEKLQHYLHLTVALNTEIQPIQENCTVKKRDYKCRKI